MIVQWSGSGGSAVSVSFGGVRTYALGFTPLTLMSAISSEFLTVFFPSRFPTWVFGGQFPFTQTVINTLLLQTLATNADHARWRLHPRTWEEIINANRPQSLVIAGLVLDFIDNRHRSGLFQLTYSAGSESILRAVGGTVFISIRKSGIESKPSSGGETIELVQVLKFSFPCAFPRSCFTQLSSDRGCNRIWWKSASKIVYYAPNSEHPPPGTPGMMGLLHSGGVSENQIWPNCTPEFSGKLELNFCSLPPLIHVIGIIDPTL
ncbi:hypothetical protein B0H16DRAFT_1856822 [Mycena metata]|uniref:Uncharacterized protein n=1 Tax=Mycena metata TaxID=1033252 RepID=A0AAD7N4C9_9AGAR|nr:hypothetical protein B0H16DRAFT_1820991 [Mycena metata]KAJ7745156.1 hypothetical protein B0H16DRAFT_1856822 [Mycena metata]